MRTLEWVGVCVIVIWGVFGTTVLLLGWGFSGGSILQLLGQLFMPQEQLTWTEYLGNLLLVFGAWPTLALVWWIKRPVPSR